MTYKQAHTTGPWFYSGYADHCDVGRPYHEIVDAQGFEVINQNGIVTTAEDATLIAAIPELLAACRDILPDLIHYAATHGPGPDKRLDAMRAAIDKTQA